MKQSKFPSARHLGNASTLAGPAAIRSEGPRTVTAGFIPLVDASVLIAAAVWMPFGETK